MLGSDVRKVMELVDLDSTVVLRIFSLFCKLLRDPNARSWTLLDSWRRCFCYVCSSHSMPWGGFLGCVLLAAHSCILLHFGVGFALVGRISI